MLDSTKQKPGIITLADTTSDPILNGVGSRNHNKMPKTFCTILYNYVAGTCSMKFDTKKYSNTISHDTLQIAWMRFYDLQLSSVYCIWI